MHLLAAAKLHKENRLKDKQNATAEGLTPTTYTIPKSCKPLKHYITYLKHYMTYFLHKTLTTVNATAMHNK